MGREAALSLNGPWTMEINFPGIFDGTTSPVQPHEIESAVRILQPPVPTLGAYGGELPTGIILKGAGVSSIRLPVFEVDSYVRSPSMLGTLKNQSYFALTEKFKGERYKTPRVCIGKIALLDDVVACSIPVREAHFSAKTIDISVPKESTVELAVAAAIYNSLNGVTEPNQDRYEKMVWKHKMQKAAEHHVTMRKIRRVLRTRSKKA